METHAVYASRGAAASNEGSRGVHRFVPCVLGGLVCGAVVAVASVWVPMNRIAVFNQPHSTYVTIASLRVARPGFLVLYLEKDGGISAEAPLYVKRGFYRNLAIPVRGADVVNLAPETIAYVARIFVDNGDGVLDDTTDTPVKNVFGHVYSKRFLMEYGSGPKRFFYAILRQPVRYIVDCLLP